MRTPRTPIVTLLALVVLAPSASAADSTAWEQADRQLQFAQDAGGFRFESVRRTDEFNDEILGTYSVDARTFTLTLIDQRTDNTTTNTLATTFEALFEYEDLDGNGAYSLGDEVVQRLRVAELPPPTRDVTSIASGGHLITFTYTVPAPLGEGQEAGTLLLRFWLLSKADTIDSELVPPTLFRHEIQLQKFPFQSNVSVVAVETRVASTQTLDEEQGELATSGGPSQVYFQWPSVGSVDGDLRPLHVTLVDSDATVAPVKGARVILRAFDRGDDLRHQSMVGARPTAQDDGNAIVELFARGDWRIYAVGVAVGALVIGGTMWRRMQK